MSWRNHINAMYSSWDRNVYPKAPLRKRRWLPARAINLGTHLSRGLSWLSSWNSQRLILTTVSTHWRKNAHLHYIRLPRYLTICQGTAAAKINSCAPRCSLAHSERQWPLRMRAQKVMRNQRLKIKAINLQTKPSALIALASTFLLLAQTLKQIGTPNVAH